MKLRPFAEKNTEKEKKQKKERAEQKLKGV